MNNEDLVAVLYDIQAYLDDHEDINDNGGPNRAMSLNYDLTEVIQALETMVWRDKDVLR
jgi:hypothetical protein